LTTNEPTGDVDLWRGETRTVEVELPPGTVDEVVFSFTAPVAPNPRRY